MLPLGLALVFVGVVNAIIGPKAKARLVFWRWDHPLPGSEAFTRYAHEDHRVDLVELADLREVGSDLINHLN